MAIKYCTLCQRRTQFKRDFGIGTFIAVLVTLGAWIFTMPLYVPRCSICKGAPTLRTMLFDRPESAQGRSDDRLKLLLVIVVFLVIAAVFQGH